MVDLYNDGYPFVVWAWCLFAFTTLFVFARLYVQLWLLARRRHWREVYIIFAWLMLLGGCICSSLMNDGDGYNSAVDWTESNYSHWGKLNMAWYFIYLPGLYACKASLLCFYAEISPRHKFPKIWWWIVISWIFVAFGVVLSTVGEFVMCFPFSAYFDIEAECDVEYYTKIDTANASLHLLTDMLVYLLPIAIFINLKGLSVKQKPGALTLFSFGFINIAIAVEYVVWQYFADTGILSDAFNFVQQYLFPLQPATAIIIVCLPYCRRLIISRRHREMETVEVAGRTQIERSGLAGTTATSGVGNDLEAARTEITAVFDEKVHDQR